MSESWNSDTTDRSPSPFGITIEVVGWLAVIGWLAAPYLAWTGYWLGVSFLGEAPTAHEERRSSVYLVWAAALGFGLPPIALVAGKVARIRRLTVMALLEGVATVAVPAMLVLFLISA